MDSYAPCMQSAYVCMYPGINEVIRTNIIINHIYIYISYNIHIHILYVRICVHIDACNRMRFVVLGQADWCHGGCALPVLPQLVYGFSQGAALVSQPASLRSCRPIMVCSPCVPMLLSCELGAGGVQSGRNLLEYDMYMDMFTCIWYV